MKRRSCERRLNNFRVSWAFQLIAESQSHFERSKVNRFIEVSPRRRRLKLLQSVKPRRMIQRLVAGCISPSLLINWIYLRPTREAEIEPSFDRKQARKRTRYNFYCTVNKLVYVTPTVCNNCARNFSRPFFASRVFLRGTFYAVLRGEMEIISRAESFDCVTTYF